MEEHCSLSYSPWLVQLPFWVTKDLRLTGGTAPFGKWAGGRTLPHQTHLKEISHGIA